MPNYIYNEPSEVPFEPFVEGDYPFTVVGIQPTYHNERGTFILPIEIRLEDTDRKILQWLSAGTSAKGKPFDMIAPFLKCIRRNPAIGEEPDFSSRNLIDATGIAHCREEAYTGNDPKYHGKMFPTVAWWIYDLQQTNATVSQGQNAKERTYGKTPSTLPAMQSGKLSPPNDDDIPF